MSGEFGDRSGATRGEAGQRGRRAATIGIALGAAVMAGVIAPSVADARGASAQAFRENLAGPQSQFSSTRPGRAYIECVRAARAERGLALAEAVEACPDEMSAAITFNARTVGATSSDVRRWYGTVRPIFLRRARSFLRDEQAAEAAGRGGFSLIR